MAHIQLPDVDLVWLFSVCKAEKKDFHLEVAKLAWNNPKLEKLTPEERKQIKEFVLRELYSYERVVTHKLGKPTAV